MNLDTLFDASNSVRNKTVDSITIRRPDDWHIHLRDGAMLRAVLPLRRDSSRAASSCQTWCRRSPPWMRPLAIARVFLRRARRQAISSR